jgi:hypothetical protein
MPDMTREQADEILRDAAEHRALTAWERNFVEEMIRYNRPLTEARIGVLRNIERKIYRT